MPNCIRQGILHSCGKSILFIYLDPVIYHNACVDVSYIPEM
jgi:hypothetical protein